MEPTQRQNDIINYDGHTVVLASPGSGKTYVMAEKIKRLLRSDSMPEYQGVIAISYTRKASGNLRTRTLEDGVPVKNSFFGTIDSFCLTQIIMPFGNYVFGHSIDAIKTINVDKDNKNFFEWLIKKTNYGDVQKEHWLNLKNLFLEGKVLIESIELIALLLIKCCTACRNHLKARFKYVFIDEFQDADTYTNDIFHELIGLGMIGIVVGDVNQSIFGYDQKSSKYLNLLENDSKFTCFKLDKNFRCAQSIVNYSNRLLDGKINIIDTNDIRMKMVEVNGDEEKIAQYLDDTIPLAKVKWEIKNLSKVAILVKYKHIQNRLNECLKIPHQVIETTLLDKDLNPKSRLFAFLLNYYFDKQKPFLSVIEEFEDFDALNMKNRLRLQSIKKAIRDTQEEKIMFELPLLFKEVANILLPNCDEGSSLTYLNEVLQQQLLLDTYRPLTDKEVVIMTLHKAKGLEFELVYHLNMNEWEFPIKKPLNGDWNNLYYPDLVQDLNLHYVGITRAKKECVLITNTKRHNKDGQVKNSSPSEFLSRNGLEQLRTNEKYGF